MMGKAEETKIYSLISSGVLHMPFDVGKGFTLVAAVGAEEESWKVSIAKARAESRRQQI